MERTPLAVYAAKRHAWTADQLGMSQGALSKAIREGRMIFVAVSADGSISAVEEKPFPGQRRDSSRNACKQISSSGVTRIAPNIPVQPSSVSS
ncbi:Cro/CI family transcriptional regulator [Pseudomonas sp. MWU12-2345]|uniref:Cro/CI family transcriptional regulator n=1 Tax=Pseudomonas sp. MWU12-2345 TaxID=2928689 RepID=UPI00200D7339